MFKQNEGNVDRLIRITVGVMALALGYTYFSGFAQTVSYIIGIAGVATGSLGFCGLYNLLGINTCPVKKNNK